MLHIKLCYMCESHRQTYLEANLSFHMKAVEETSGKGEVEG